MRTWAPTIGLLAAALALALACGPANAGLIEQGSDRLKTQPGSFWDFWGDEHRIDGGTFGPGSDPFEGQVAVVTDTKVWRSGGSDFAENPDVIPVEIVELSLHSAGPVTITFDGGARAELYDVVVTLDPSGPNSGAYVLSHNPAGQPDGGEIDGDDDDPWEPTVPPDSFFDVSFRFEFFPQTGGPVTEVTRSDSVHLTADVPWSHTAPPLYLHPDSGGFFPGVDPFADPLPNDYVPQTMIFQGQAFTWHLRLEPIPEPATLGLLALGVMALLRRRRAARAGS